MSEPLLAEQGECARGKRDVAVFEPLAAADLELHAGAVDPANLEIDAFADAETTGVDGGQAGVVGGPMNVVENTPDFLDAQDDGQALDRARTKQVEAGPGALEGDLEEELEGSNGNRSGGAREAANLVEGEKELAKILIGSQFRDLPMNSASCWI